MKKFGILLAISFCSSVVFGQLKIKEDGNVAVESNLAVTKDVTVTGGFSVSEFADIALGLTVKGFSGQPDRGTFCVSSSITYPNWDPGKGDYLSLISAQSRSGQTPFANYYNNQCNFRVNYDGGVYTKYGLIQSSDSVCKKNVSSLPAVLNKIQSLRGVSFDYIEEVDEQSDSASVPLATSRFVTSLSPVQQQMEAEKSRKRIGLIAQEVEKIYPEVVRTQADGTKGILYSDLVAVLIEGIKELSTEVVTLHEQIEMLQNGKVQTGTLQKNTGKSSKMFEEAILYQNNPNPFNQVTEIAYRIPQEVTASIHIYNLSGQELKSYSLGDTNGAITIAASEFTPGIYIYSLIIDNQEIDSKRMVLTK